MAASASASAGVHSGEVVIVVILLQLVWLVPLVGWLNEMHQRQKCEHEMLQATAEIVASLSRSQDLNEKRFAMLFHVVFQPMRKQEKEWQQ